MSLKRLLKWVRKTEPQIMMRSYEVARDIMVERAVEFQSKHQANIIKVRNFIERHVINPFLKMPYISYGQRIAKICEKYGGKLAVKMAVGEAMLWRQRGLDDFLLIEIPKLFNLDITHEYMMASSATATFQTILHEYQVVVEEPEIPVELISFRDSRLQGVEGYIKITPMGEDDVVEIEEYVDFGPGIGMSLLNKSEVKVSELDGQTLRFPLRILRYGYKIVITSKKYAPRIIPVHFNRIIYGV